MARDRNVYVWQAYVTVMSIVSLACLGALIFVIFQSGTNSKTVEGALAREQKATDELRKTTNARQILERILGVGAPLSESEFNQLKSTSTDDQKLNETIKVYEKNMGLFGPGASDPSYTKLVATLMQELRSRNTQVDAAGKREIEMKNNYEDTIARETKARDAEKQKAQDLANQLEKELTKYTEKVDQQQQEIKKIESDKQIVVLDLNKKLKDALANLDKSRLDKAELTKRIDGLRRLLDEIKGEDFQYVQGKITQVTDGGDTVYINLGKADRLRPGVTFGVLDADITSVTKSKPKAKIEVVEVLYEHLSRCKVLSDRAPTVILVGDSIYSPGWQPGKDVKFALIGKMDIDGDTRDDTAMLKQIITQNGGIVAAELSPSGTMTGKLTEDISYLVIGEEFRVLGKELDPSSAAAAKKRAEIELEAKSLGIAKITVDKLLNWLRSSSTNEVVPLGNALRGKLQPNPKGDGKPTDNGRVSELFQSRDGKAVRAVPQQ